MAVEGVIVRVANASIVGVRVSHDVKQKEKEKKTRSLGEK